MVQELSMLVAPALSILLLLLGALGLLEEALAVGLALWNGVVQLIGWGIDVGRRRGQAWPTALLTGLVNSAFGVVIVLLECSCTNHGLAASLLLPGPGTSRRLRASGTTQTRQLGLLSRTILALQHHDGLGTQRDVVSGVHHVQQHLQPGGVQRGHHGLELGHLAAGAAGPDGGQVAVVGAKNPMVL